MQWKEKGMGIATTMLHTHIPPHHLPATPLPTACLPHHYPLSCYCRDLPALPACTLPATAPPTFSFPCFHTHTTLPFYTRLPLPPHLPTLSTLTTTPPATCHTCPLSCCTTTTTSSCLPTPLLFYTYHHLLPTTTHRPTRDE